MWYVLNMNKGHKIYLEDCASVSGLCPRKNNLSEFSVLFEFIAKFLKKLNSCTPFLIANLSCILEHTVLPEHFAKALMPRSLFL